MAVYKENIVDIELTSGNIHRSFLAHAIGAADNKADRFGIRVFRNGEPVNLSNASIQGYFRDPHGNNIAITSGNGKNQNVAWVTLPQACYNYDGQFCLAIKLVGDGVTGTIRIVDGVVNNTNTNNAVAPTGAVPTYQEILAVYEQMVEVKNGAVRFDTTQDINQAGRQTARENIRAASYTMLAPAFSENSIYAVGECVIYDQNLWRCKAAVSTPGSWTGSTNWEKIALANEVGAMITITNIGGNKYRLNLSR